MKSLILALTATLFATPLLAQEPIAQKPENVSFRNEVQIAIDRGLGFLKEQQKAAGSWSSEDYPALTALPLIAFHREPSGKYRDPSKHEFLQRGYDFVRKHAQPDGGIYAKGLSNYNTSICLIALLGTGNPKDEPLIEKARQFIVNQQAKGMADESLDGGIGYGPTGVSPKRQHPDLDNTLIALEALRAYKAARPTKEITAAQELNWQAAIDFISRTQNLPATNPKASTDEANKGGFVYYPGFSHADPAEGPKALRSYGSMTYAGLLSFIYADLKKDDQRVVAALDWLKKNYNLEENPGMGKQGFYYYLHLMTKGLTAAGVEELELANGKKVDWEMAVAKKVLDLQQGDGSWVNDNSRWMEKDPVLVTTYCVLTLELIYHRL